MKVWLVGQSYWVGDHLLDHWEIAGIFDSEDAAVAACRNWTYWVAPFELNAPQPEESFPMEGAYYPYFNDRDDEVTHEGH